MMMLLVRRSRSSGFSMVELLVAVLVMGIGVLGVTALQMVSLQNNRAALVRAEAVNLAYDMMDRIRANPVGAPIGKDYEIDFDDAPPDENCVGASCSADQMVDFDLAMWKCSLGSFEDNAVCAGLFEDGLLPASSTDADRQQQGLPDGDGSISVDGDGVVTITVRWSEPNGAVQTVQIDSQG